MKMRKGFTLVEILIVVAILGILAAIVIPHLSLASDEAKLSALESNLQAIRSQLELYKTQHNGTYAGLSDGDLFKKAITGCTKADGSLVAAGTAGALGPYMHKIPANPFDNANGVTVNEEGPDGIGGWYFNPATGAFSPNDEAHTTW